MLELEEDINIAAAAEEDKLVGLYTLMEEMYGLQSTADYGDKGFQSTTEYDDRGALMTPENLILPLDYHSLLHSSVAFREHNHHQHQREAMFGSNDIVLYSAASEAASTIIAQREEDVFDAIKTRIASHPTYPRLIHAYIECQKVNKYLINYYLISINSC